MIASLALNRHVEYESVAYDDLSNSETELGRRDVARQL